MKTKRNLFYVFAVMLLILTVVFGNIAFDKYTNYNNGDYVWEHINVYVGGDAYNYIINGTYFTAFAVYSVGCGIGSIICFAFGALFGILNTSKEDRERESRDLFKQIRIFQSNVSSIEALVEKQYEMFSEWREKNIGFAQADNYASDDFGAVTQEESSPRRRTRGRI